MSFKLNNSCFAVLLRLKDSTDKAEFNRFSAWMLALLVVLPVGRAQLFSSLECAHSHFTQQRTQGAFRRTPKWSIVVPKLCRIAQSSQSTKGQIWIHNFYAKLTGSQFHHRKLWKTDGADKLWLEACQFVLHFVCLSKRSTQEFALYKAFSEV